MPTQSPIDIYVEKYIKAIKANVNNDENLINIINKIYEDGFTDGCADNYGD